MAGDRVALEGAYNFRDLGGIRAGAGRVRIGRAFRSDGLHRLTAADHAMLRELGIARVYDLRSHTEVTSDGVCAAPGVRLRHLPLVAETLDPFDPAVDWAAMDLGNRYVRMLSEGAPTIACIISELAEPEAPPAVFHCSGGKDRTGVVAAVLLRALGVADDAIVADYAISERHLGVAVRARRRRFAELGLDDEAVAYLTASPPERMRRMLERLDALWGSTDRYLGGIGVGPEVIESLRRNLLEGS